MSETLKGKISAFGCSVDEVFTLLGCYAAYVGSCFTNSLSWNVGKRLTTYTA